jgi:hypothetical protein
VTAGVVAPRLRQSPIRWLFCAIGLSFAVVHFSAEYAIYALLAWPGSLPCIADESRPYERGHLAVQRGHACKGATIGW